MHSQKLKTEVKENCSICYISYSRSIFQTIRPLEICYGCWYNHVKTAITKISYQIGSDIMSPYEGGLDMDVCMALNSLNSEDREALEQWLFKKYATFTPDIEKCPSETCDFVFTSQKCKWGPNTNYNCPKCEIPLLSTQTTGLKSILGFVYFLLFASKCPKCEIPIERISGCPHMTCPCGHQFCWYCLKDYRATKDSVYTVHEPKECVFIMLSKILLVIICCLSIVLTVVGFEGFKAFTAVLSVVFSLLIRVLILDMFIAVQVITTMIVMSPTENRRKGFLNSLNRKNYFLAQVLINLTFLVFLYLLDQLWTFSGIFGGQLCIVGLGIGSIALFAYSADTWFEYIA